MLLIRIVTIVVIITSIAHATTPNILETDKSVSPEATAPNPFSLLGEWWLYVDTKHENLPQRIQYVKNVTKEAVQATTPAVQKELNSSLQQIFSYLEELIELKELKEEIRILASFQETYSVEELILLFSAYYENKASRDRLISVLEDEESKVRNLEKVAEEKRLLYLDIKGKTEEKLRLGLSLMVSRLNWFLYIQELPKQQAKLEYAVKQTENSLEEIRVATERLFIDDSTYSQIDAFITKQTSEVKAIQNKLVQVKDKYAENIGLDSTERLNERLFAQKILLTEVQERQEIVKLSQLELVKSLIVQKDTQRTVEDYDYFEKLKASEQLLKQSNTDIKQWRESTKKEGDAIETLLSDGHIDEEDSSSRKIIDQRIDVSKETVRVIASLQQSLFNLEILTDALNKQLGETYGLIFKVRSAGSFIFEQTLVRAWNLINAKLFALGDVPVTIWALMQAVFILMFAYLLGRLLQSSLIKLNTSPDGKIPPAIYTLARVIFYLVIVLGLFIAFSSIGVNFTNIAIVAGALSVGIGFGLQSVVNNFVSGIIILFEHNIKVGDFIELDSGLKGTVRDINVRSTIVNTLDNLDIIVPNSELVASKVTNYTLNEPIVRIHIPFGVAYGTDKELVKKAVLEAARDIDITYDDGVNRRPQVWLVEFGDSSLNFELVTWLNPKLGRHAPGSWRALYSWEIESALKRYGIEIPFPQRDLHLKSGFEGFDKFQPQEI